MNSPKPNTLWNRWQENAEKFPDRSAIIHWVAGEEPIRISFKELIETAKKFSIMIHKSGIKKGDVCAIIIKHNPLFYPLYLGIIRTGVLPSILAYPNPRLHPDKFRQGLEGMAQRSGLDYMLIQSDLESLVKPLVEKPGSTIKSIFHPLEWNLDAEFDPKIDEEIESISQTIDENDALLLQHSSGTTGLQKPVILSHAAVLKHVKNFGKALKFNEKDIISTWLPLYHDMGLIGAFHLPLAYGIPSIQIDPFEWVLAPIIHLESISKERATVGFLPNFAYNIYAEKIHDEELAELDLSSLRLLVNASEPIRHDSHQKFADKMEKYGFNPLALTGMYGMAEMTLSVIQTEPGTKIKEVTVDRNKLSNGIVELATENSVPRVCVSSGKLIDGCQIKIVDDNRNLIPKNLVGEIAVKSVSQFDGYRNYPEKTAEVVDQEGWYYSGDYGFEYEGEFFIIGRKKDIIIVAGKNIYPEDIEDAINQVNGVIPGRVIAFGEDDAAMGTEFVSVVAETKYETNEQKNELRIAILRAGMSIDVVIHKVYIVPARWLIKSSSGKPSRKANKERLTEENDPQVWSK
jgi:acyl-CoA synthetase (AMP-forming)/AMP-acid ligase II